MVCVNLVDRTEPTTITDFAENNNVPIIFFNRELVAEDLERWKDLYYVGADASESGTLEGELAADAFKENAAMDKNSDGICQYVVLEGEAGHQDSIVRTEYSVNTMVEKGVETLKIMKINKGLSIDSPLNFPEINSMHMIQKKYLIQKK